MLDRARLPAGALATAYEMDALRTWLTRSDRTGIRKIALYGDSSEPAFDLDYRFVQCLPGGGFDFRSGCGHSLLACVVAAGRLGSATRVRVVNTGLAPDTAVCEPAADGTYTVHLDRTPPVGLADLLPTGLPREQIGAHSVSLVGLGNPYVFVAATDLGLSTKDELFHADTDVFVRLLRLRAAAARRLGLPPRGALPKVAAVGAYDDGRLAVRALTEPGWHPALALTGTSCLAAAAIAPGTIPNLLAKRAGCAGRILRLDTAGGTVSATPETTSAGSLRRVSVHGKRAVVLERAVSLPWRTHVTA